ncbi:MULTISPECIES: ABC transporter permease [Streptomyces]|uniref:ABC transporter permease n=1 Tax=Streptomyces TaxID=1883 RepID=UPI0004AB5A83|nr:MULTISPECIES: ABC transporter permease [Streptomyces]
MTTATETTPRQPGALSAAISDSFAVAGRNLLNYRRVPSLLMASTVQPVMTVLLFYFIFGGAIPVPGHEYVDYLIPGILGWSVIIGAQGTAVGLAADVKAGLVQRMWSLPVSRPAFLAGRIIADTVRNAVVAVIVLGMGLLLGFRPDGSPAAVAAGVALMLLFGFAASWIFAAIGLGVGNPESAQAATFPPMILMVFSSSAFVPPDTMKGWLQPYAEHQPLSAALGAVRGLMLGEATTGAVIEALAWVVGLLVVFVPLAVRGYRKAA